MTVREIDPDRIVKIGTMNGSSYLFCGRFADADLPGINKYCEAQTTLAIMRLFERIRLCTDERKQKVLYKKLLSMDEYRMNYVPIYNREVIAEFKSILERGVDILLIPGTEVGWQEMVRPDMGISYMDNQGMIQLAGAICRGMMDVLVARYADCFNKPGNEGIWEAAKRAELYITESNFAMLKDPKYLVMCARREAAEKIEKRTSGITKAGIVKTLGVRLDNGEQEKKRL